MHSNFDLVKAWKNPSYRAELEAKGIDVNMPVESNLDLSLIKGGTGSGNVHTVSGECNAMGHVHDCTTAQGASEWLLDNIYSAIGWTC